MEIPRVLQFQTLLSRYFLQLSSYRMVVVHLCNHFSEILLEMRTFLLISALDVYLLRMSLQILRVGSSCASTFSQKLDLWISANNCCEGKIFFNKINFYPEKFPSRSMIESSVMYIMLVSKIFNRVDWCPHSLISQMGSKVCCVCWNKYEDEKPPNTTNYTPY